MIPERPDLERGDVVVIREPNIKPWFGLVLTVKPSTVSGWWVEVRRNDSYQTWSVPADYVRRG